jgi:OmpA-OmpF porin, OOP family
MVNKKYTLLVALILTLGISSYAQTTSFAWDWKDSSVVPAKSVEQYHEFMQNKNPFPTKPRNAWEFSVGGGPSTITGDVNSKLGFGGSLTLRKALNNIFSYRLGYFGSLNYGGNGTIYNYAAYSSSPETAPIHSYTASKYKNISHNLAVELIASLNTFSNYRGDPTSNLYVLAGVGLGISGTEIKNAAGTYQYEEHIPQTQLLHEQNHQLYFTTFDIGAGYAYKINKKFNIAVEERITSPVKHVNYITGYNSQTGTKNIYYFTAFKLNFNLF